MKRAWILLAATVAAGLTGCSGTPPAAEPTPTSTAPQPDRDRLAGLAAAAQGNAYVASYLLTTRNLDDRTVTVAVGTDGSWVVGLPATGLSGLVNMAMFQSRDGLFQCVLGPAEDTGGRPDLDALRTPGCVRVAGLTATTDPRVQHIFSDWLPALTDRATALSVTLTATPAGVQGTCFSVESTSAALAPPVDPGSYCFDPDGLLTAATVGFGAVRLIGNAAAAPPSVALPAPVVNRAPVPMVAPPAPVVTPKPSGSASPSP